ncbi:hypothetical protein LSM04_004763 [Trypanosoma melophagium]|uniref:uncharacterized protein n=1 Tax=Trypanosoma melophagium TaxID=715481 RepID=UPI003519FF61|nr:hypothetical protein LSM04_004763 [Trypanosoma melophagium]
MFLKNVNSALNFYSGEKPTPSSIAILAIPPLPPVSSNDLENIVLAAIYEDIQQAFLRSSDREVIQWQRTGLCTPPQLQPVIDSLDNYSLLKVLYGLGGVLSVAQSVRNPETIKVALTGCAKHARVKFHPSTLLLSIEHSFVFRQL